MMGSKLKPSNGQPVPVGRAPWEGHPEREYGFTDPDEHACSWCDTPVGFFTRDKDDGRSMGCYWSDVVVTAGGLPFCEDCYWDRYENARCVSPDAMLRHEEHLEATKGATNE